MEIKQELQNAITKFRLNNPKSFDAHELARNHLPGGSTRSVLYTHPFPISLLKGEGAKLWDIDGRCYTDFMGEMSAGIYGHSHPVIKQAIHHVIDEIGLSLGGTTVHEKNLAEEIQKRFHSIATMRFCNSGTEANIQCLLAAKFFTKKSKIICFGGAYHGGPLVFGKGSNEYNINHQDFVVARYNSIEDFDAKFNENLDSLAGVIVEAMLGAGGCVNGDSAFLLHIQERCNSAGVVFILDEVMTSRLGYGGLQGEEGLSPDLTSLGKYLGGGLTFGAFGGRADIMDCFIPSNPSYLPHSGTFNNNTMTMYVGHQGLTKVLTGQALNDLNSKGDYMRNRLADAAKGTKMHINGRGSILNIHFLAEGDGSSPENISSHSVSDLKDLFWLEMLENNFWLASRGMLSLSVAITQDEIESFIHCVENWIKRRYHFINF